jgi:HK97 family phage portal protein
MGFIKWLQDKLGGGAVPVGGKAFAEEFAGVSEEYREEYCELYIRELAFLSAVGLIGRAVSKCEFKTFSRGAETRGDEFYRWNIAPNLNQNSSAFLQKLIAVLYRNGECLVIDFDRQLYVADGFVRNEDLKFGDTFTQVSAGPLNFGRTFLMSDVLYFSLGEDARRVMAGISASYAALIQYTMTSYKKSRGVRGIFKYDALPIAGTDDRKRFDELTNTRIKTFLGADNAALPLGHGQDWQELDKKTYNNDSTRDIRAMIDDIFDFTARAFGIPPALLSGTVQDVGSATDAFLTFCVDPLTDMLSEEINRKLYGRAEYLAGSRLAIDTRAVKHIDLLSVSAAVDKLIASGVFSVNDIRRLCGENAIAEPWADEHFMTKNYVSVDEAVTARDAIDN